MSSAARGTNISAPEVTHISSHGLWVLVAQSEYFLAFQQFPWFREAAIDKILHVVELVPGHLHWPDLDVDLELESIEHPERFPLVADA